MIKKLNQDDEKIEKKPPYKRVKKVIAVGITILVLAVVLIANAKKNLLF
jgi:quinol-cytochrome oxidoreductase complex cytochrome b subunit